MNPAGASEKRDRHSPDSTFSAEHTAGLDLRDPAYDFRTGYLLCEKHLRKSERGRARS
jgi:hypothetical protein